MPNFEKGVVKIGESVTHQQVDRDLLCLIPAKNDSHFPLQVPQKRLKNVIIAEYYIGIL